MGLEPLAGATPPHFSMKWKTMLRLRSDALYPAGRAFFAAALAAALLASPARAADAAKPADRDTLYAIGALLSQSLRNFSLSAAELETVKEGLTDGALGRPSKVDLGKQRPLVNELARARMSIAAEAEKKAGADYLAKAAAEPGVARTASGGIVKTLKAGGGAAPTAADKVTVHYVGRLVDGTEFDSSRRRGEPATFSLGGVIRCWTEGLQKMKVGGLARLTCPSDIAYGERGAPPLIKPGATLVFEVELIGIGGK